MALIGCRECGTEMSSEADVCPNCGAPVKRRGMSWATGCLVVLVVGAIAFMFSPRTNSSSSRSSSEKASGSQEVSPRPTHDLRSAWRASQDFVSQYLKAPASAKWPAFGFMEANTYEEFVTYLGDGQYNVKAWVDAQNTFGAMIRNPFTCSLKWVEGEKWRLLFLVIDDKLVYLGPELKKMADDAATAVLEKVEQERRAEASRKAVEQEQQAEASRRAKEEEEMLKKKRQENEALLKEREAAEQEQIKRNTRAAGKLSLARNYANSNARPLAIKTLEKLIEEYPDTEAAQEARQLLEQWRKQAGAK